jgi:hypothetical protein
MRIYIFETHTKEHVMAITIVFPNLLIILSSFLIMYADSIHLFHSLSLYTASLRLR